MAMFMNDRPMQKVLLKNTTRMSLHERFTYLRNNTGDGSSATQTQRELQQMTARNRRLALQMERRPAVMAALKLKKRSLRQRLGLNGSAGISAIGGGGLASRGGFNSIKDRLSLGRKGRKGGRGGVRLGQQQQSPQQRRSRSRGGGSNMRGRLSRSQSMQSLNNANKFGNRARSRSRSRSRVRTNSISNNNLNNNGQVHFRSKSQNRGGPVRGIGGGRFIQRGRQMVRGGRGGSMFRGRRIGNNWGSGRGRRGGNDRGRGGMRGRGGRGRGRGVRGGRGRGGARGNNPVPTKEELDNQLDQYMANTRYGLDKDIDAYMKEANSTGMSTGTGNPKAESWD